MACQIYYSLMSHLTPHVWVHARTHTEAQPSFFFFFLEPSALRGTVCEDRQTPRSRGDTQNHKRSLITFSIILKEFIQQRSPYWLENIYRWYPAWPGADPWIWQAAFLLDTHRGARCRNQLRTPECATWSKNSRWLQGQSRWRLKWCWQSLAGKLMIESGFNRPPTVM